MANVNTDTYLENNKRYAKGEAIHKPVHPGKQPIAPARHVAVVACMDARIDVEDLLGLAAILSHPWIPTEGPDAVTVRGFIYDVDTGLLDEVSYPGPMGSIG